MEQQTPEFDHACMELAIAEARNAPAEDMRVHPAVGAVAARGRTVLGAAFRGEFVSGEHAEYVLLERKLGNVPLVGATVYSTLEPCTSRHHWRMSCAARLIERQVGRVVVGIVEPNPYLAGRGISALTAAGVLVEFFPRALTTAVEHLNVKLLSAARSSLPPVRLRLSAYEWELLESNGSVAGRSQDWWHECFLATNDLSNLGRLRQFYTPPKGQIVDAKAFDLPAAEPSRISIATDLRLVELVTGDPARLLSLSSREFEHFTAELLQRLGYANVKIGRGSKDGGVDVSAYVEHPFGVERVIVQCKRQSHDYRVGEPVVKQLLADVGIHHAARGLIVTTSYLTRGARLLVDTYRYRLSSLDYDELLRVLRGGEPEAASRLTGGCTRRPPPK